MKFEISDDMLILNNCIIGYEDSDGIYLLDDDMSIEMLYDIKSDDLLENISFFGRTIESEYIDIDKNNGQTKITLSFIIELLDWKENITITSFKDKMIEKINSHNRYEMKATFESDETAYIHIEKIMSLNESFKELFLNIKDIYFTYKSEIMNINRIENKISFSPEHLIAGSSILQYFGKLLQEKYPNEKISVSIKQEGLKVTMIVEMPNGKKEEIEEYLNRYGMVIMNQLPPEEFASNPIQLLELKHELRDAQNKIISQQKILALKDETYKNRILSLEDDLKFLREEFSAIRRSNDKSINTLLSSLLSKDKLIKKLTKSIDKKDELETKQLLLELKDKDNNGYIGLKQHLDNVMIGGIVNAPSWIQFTMGIITKL